MISSHTIGFKALVGILLAIIKPTIQQSFPDSHNQSFDFIVVGGGTSGCIVASRLSKEPNHNVLLIHDGGFPNADLDVAGLTIQYLTDPTVMNFYDLVPQKNAVQKFDGKITHLEGKVLGGGSGVNGMFYNRGHPKDYDNWAEVTNDSSWKYSNMLKYFKRIEDYNGDYHSKEQHGYGGPIPISAHKYAPGQNEFLSAGRELGYKVGDPNGPQTLGFAPSEFNTKRGKRVSSFEGYLKPFIGKRRNLQVLTNAKAMRVLFEGKTAVGVQYLSNGNKIKNQDQLQTVLAKKEIIISAGAISSPTILLKSGVGPRNVLNSAKVPIIKELPVGKNLHDHVFVRLNIVVSKEAEVFDPKRDLTPENLQLFHETGEGPYSTYSAASSQAFLASSKAEFSGTEQWPDIHLVPIASSDDIGLDILRPDFNYNDLSSSEQFVACAVIVSRPKSRGSLTLNTTNIDSFPVIDMGYLTHEDDVDVMIEGIQNVIKIYETTEAYKQINAHLPLNPIPACQGFTYRSNDYWKCFLRQEATNTIHAAGSCKMGKGSQDPDAVLDSNLRVIGVNGLRVVDTSIMPNVVNANTQAAAFVIAEKASDMILREWDCHNRAFWKLKHEV